MSLSSPTPSESVDLGLIFLSYASKDRALVSKFYNALEEHGHNVWMDCQELAGGQDWERELEAYVRKCEIMLVCVTPAMRESEWVAKENHLAKMLNKTIIPLLLEGDDLPMRFINLHYIDCRNVEKGIQHLLRDLTKLKGGMKLVAELSSLVSQGSQLCEAARQEKEEMQLIKALLNDLHALIEKWERWQSQGSISDEALTSLTKDMDEVNLTLQSFALEETQWSDRVKFFLQGREKMALLESARDKLDAALKLFQSQKRQKSLIPTTLGRADLEAGHERRNKVSENSDLYCGVTRRTLYIITVAVILAIGLSVALVLGLSKSTEPRETPILVETTSPTPSPVLVEDVPTDGVVEFVQLGEAIDGEAPDDRFGYRSALSFDGSRIAVAATQNDGSNGPDSGHVRVYQWDGSDWTQVGLDIDGEVAGDFMGSVGISADGNRIVSGSKYHDYPEDENNVGSVRIFEWDGVEWHQLGSTIYGKTVGESFGIQVWMSDDGNRFVSGATSRDGNETDPGLARVYDYDGDDWVQLGEDLVGEGEGDEFGSTVSISADGNHLLVGGRFNDGQGIDSGHLRVFDWNETDWVQKGEDIDGMIAGGRFGSSGGAISADGRRITAGAPLHGNGRVRVYEWGGSAWSQLGNDLSGRSDGDLFGASVSMSADGNRVVSGARNNDANGENAGSIRTFEWNGDDWEQIGESLTGEEKGDLFGVNVAMSADGKRIAAGAVKSDGSNNNAKDAGQVRIFEWRQN